MACPPVVWRVLAVSLAVLVHAQCAEPVDRSWLAVLEQDVLVPIACADDWGQFSNPWLDSQSSSSNDDKDELTLAEIPSQWTQGCGPLPGSWNFYHENGQLETIKIAGARRVPGIWAGVKIAGLKLNSQTNGKDGTFVTAGRSKVYPFRSLRPDAEDSEKIISLIQPILQKAGNRKDQNSQPSVSVAPIGDQKKYYLYDAKVEDCPSTNSTRFKAVIEKDQQPSMRVIESGCRSIDNGKDNAEETYEAIFEAGDRTFFVKRHVGEGSTGYSLVDIKDFENKGTCCQKE